MSELLPEGLSPSLESWEFLERFERIAGAREAGLILLAKGIPHVILREGNYWVVKVERSALEEAHNEWEAFRSETPLENGRSERDRETGWQEGKLVDAEQVGGLWAVVFGMAIFAASWVAQSHGGMPWEDLGMLDAAAVVHDRQWWRVFTALTLHGGVGHLVMNLAGALLFGGALIGRFGQGLSWALVLGSGALGNLCNAFFYACTGWGGHRSLGASTAVFGALGVLTGAGVVSILRHAAGFSWWRWVVPLGAGLGLLAQFGSGGREPERVDLLAHFFGFGVGGVLGAIAALGFPRRPTHPLFQGGAGLLSLLALSASWIWAWRIR